MDIQLKSNTAPLQAQTPAAVSASSGVEKTGLAGTVVANKTDINTTIAEQQDKQQQQLDEAVSSINALVQHQQRTIRFSVDEQSGRDVVMVMDQLTDEVIRQIPAEELLVIARQLTEHGGEETLNLFSSQA